MSTLHIAARPSCGTPKIKKVLRNWSGTYQGQRYTVPSLEFYPCPACGEKVYDREAMREIEAHWPAFASARVRP